MKQLDLKTTFPVRKMHFELEDKTRGSMARFLTGKKITDHSPLWVSYLQYLLSCGLVEEEIADIFYVDKLSVTSKRFTYANRDAKGWDKDIRDLAKDITIYKIQNPRQEKKKPLGTPLPYNVIKYYFDEICESKQIGSYESMFDDPRKPIEKYAMRVALWCLYLEGYSSSVIIQTLKGMGYRLNSEVKPLIKEMKDGGYILERMEAYRLKYNREILNQQTQEK